MRPRVSGAVQAARFGVATWPRIALSALGGVWLLSFVLALSAALLVNLPRLRERRAFFAGALALAFIVLPVVVRTTDEMLRLVPSQMREAALSLGIPQWKVIVQVLYRSASAGIITGILLGLLVDGLAVLLEHLVLAAAGGVLQRVERQGEEGEPHEAEADPTSGTHVFAEHEHTAQQQHDRRHELQQPDRR